MTKFMVLLEDITKLKVDAIVNAANESLLGGYGVDGAIHRAAGKELLAECRTLNGCKTGEAKVTKGYKLPAKYVIHTVGPRYRLQSKEKSAVLLESCYIKSLNLAVELGLKSIAFPAISCGAYGYPLADAVEIAVKTVREYPKINELDEIIFSVIDAFTKNVYDNVLNS